MAQPDRGMGTDPIDLGRQGGLYKPLEVALKVLFGCFLFSLPFSLASFLNRTLPSVPGAISGDV